MGAKCTATTTNGEPCGAYALQGKKFCFTHDPARAAERVAARKLGGLNRRTVHAGDPSSLPQKVRSMTDVLDVLDYTLQETIALNNGIHRSRTLISLCEAYSKALEVGDLEARIAALEAARNENKS